VPVLSTRVQLNLTDPIADGVLPALEKLVSRCLPKEEFTYQDLIDKGKNFRIPPKKQDFKSYINLAIERLGNSEKILNFCKSGAVRCWS